MVLRAHVHLLNPLDFYFNYVKAEKRHPDVSLRVWRREEEKDEED